MLNVNSKIQTQLNYIYTLYQWFCNTRNFIPNPAISSRPMKFAVEANGMDWLSLSTI